MSVAEKPFLRSITNTSLVWSTNNDQTSLPKLPYINENVKLFVTTMFDVA